MQTATELSTSSIKINRWKFEHGNSKRWVTLTKTSENGKVHISLDISPSTKTDYGLDDIPLFEFVNQLLKECEHSK
jgi:hypothetical protein